MLSATHHDNGFWFSLLMAAEAIGIGRRDDRALNVACANCKEAPVYIASELRLSYWRPVA